MKKILTIFCLGLAACLTGCNDDGDENIYGTVPFTLTAELPERQATAGEEVLAQGNWAQGTQLAMMKISSTGVDKIVLTHTSGDTFTGEASTKIYDEDKLTAFYPADVITAASSDTLTQEIILSGQDGTIDGVARYDFAWGEGTAAMTDLSGSSAMEMERLMHIRKFSFTTADGEALPAVSSIVVTAAEDTLYAGGTFSMKNGGFEELVEGSISLKNLSGMPNGAYIAFIPSKARLHFTIVTTAGEVYETTMAESVVMTKGEIGTPLTLACTPLPEAKVGDYYYSDATYSTVKDESKTCIGVVYALNGPDGNINRSLTSSPHGRIIALKDAQRNVKWANSATDMEAVENFTFVQDTLILACLPYYDGTPNSYSSTDTKEWIKGLSIDTGTGIIAAWASQGVLTDFDGEAYAPHFARGYVVNAAAGYCHMYNTEGKGEGQWYLPAAGDLALIWILQRTGVVCSDRQEGFSDMNDAAYWSSSEWGEGRAWYIHFMNGMIVANSKESAYRVRAVSAF